jgi:hypothetical protein
LFDRRGYHARMSDTADALTAATAEDVTNALAFALRFSGRKRVHNADEIMSSIVAKRLVEHLERSGFVVMKRPPIGGSTPPYRGGSNATSYNDVNGLARHVQYLRNAWRRTLGDMEPTKKAASRPDDLLFAPVDAKVVSLSGRRKRS